VRQGELNVSEHLGGDRANMGSGEFLVVDVPGNRRWLGEGREAKAKSATRDGERVVDVEVGEGGGGGFTNKNGNARFRGVLSEG